jgi:type II secretory pathway component GspD/PulD (secretin)
MPSNEVAPARDKLILNFHGAPVDMVLQVYSQKTGLTFLRSPAADVNRKRVTLVGEYPSLDAYCRAIETALKDEGIRIVRTGASFAKVVPWKEEQNSNDLDQLVPAPVTTNGPGVARIVKFHYAPVEVVLQTYANWAGKPMFVSRDLPRTSITLQTQKKLSQQECLQAIDTVLLLHGIRIVVIDGDRLGAILATTPESKRMEIISTLTPLKVGVEYPPAREPVEQNKRDATP